MLLSLRSHSGKTFQHWGCKMAYYPDVNPGEPFKPVASLENELRHMVNAQDGFRFSGHSAGMPQNLTIPVFNATNERLEEGIPVSFIYSEDGAKKFYDSDAVPVGKYSGSRWGVLVDPLDPGEFGNCVVSGAVIVKGGPYRPETLSPTPDGFSHGGSVTCIYSASEVDKYKTMVLLGSGDEAGNFITAINDTDEMIKNGTFVTIESRQEKPSGFIKFIFYIRPGVEAPYGVVTSDCPPGESCSVQISGLAFSQNFSFTAPNTVKLSPYHRLLNYGAGEYNNYFKVEAVERDPDGIISKVKIYDGGDPDSGYAGDTDVGSADKGELSGHFSAGVKFYLRLGVASGTAPYYTHDYSAGDTFDNRVPMLLLAEVSRNNAIIQRWTAGKVYWRDRYVIPVSNRRPT